MNKLSIYNDLDSKEVRLRLISYLDNGNITVAAVNRNGEAVSGGALITINRRGTIKRHTGVNPHLGFELDVSGRIKLEPETTLTIVKNGEKVSP